MDNNKQSATKRILIVSDGTGATAKRLLDAVLAQHPEDRDDYFLENIHTHVHERVTLDAILDRAGEDHLVLFSFVDRDLDRHCHDVLTHRAILHLNVLEPMVLTLAKFLGIHPDYDPGFLQIIDDRYYRRVDAIGFTVEHDDGRGHHIDEADVVLLGLSRTCKTPISMYLACNYGLKTANIPIFASEQVLAQIQGRVADLPRSRLFGLSMNLDVLAKVRRGRRVVQAGKGSQLETDLGSYCSRSVIREEVRLSQRFFGELDLEVIEVTWRAIEEVANDIVGKLNGGRPVPKSLTRSA